MENFNLYNQVSSPYFGVIIAIITILPLLLVATIFRPKYKNDKKIKKSKLFNISNILRIISFIFCIAILCIFKDSYDIKNTNIWFGIMLFFYVLYYELIIRYIVRGRRQKDLYKPFMYVKVPIAICISGGMLFTGIWSKNIYLIISSIIFCISNIYVSYMTYYNKFVDGTYTYWSIKDKMYKTANFLVEKPSLTMEFSYDEMGFDDFTIKLTKSSEV